MIKKIKGKNDKNLKARIVKRNALKYGDGADISERPPHVRAASSLAPFGEELAIIQDDAQFLALVKPDSSAVRSFALPASASGYRVFGADNHHEKLDLEACVPVPGTANKVLAAFGSGSKDNREWIMLVDWQKNPHKPDIKLHHADSLFNAMRANKVFSGAGLNIEGAIFVDKDTLRLYQRGNMSDAKLPSIDATADLDWSDVMDYLEDELREEPPTLQNIVQYDLGHTNGADLNFSDAEKVGDAVLFSASAESGTTGENKGSAIGIIQGETVRWCELDDQDGSIFRGKIEGLSVDPKNPKRLWFVIDDDDAEKPSEIFEAELEGNWYS